MKIGRFWNKTPKKPLSHSTTSDLPLFSEVNTAGGWMYKVPDFSATGHQWLYSSEPHRSQLSNHEFEVGDRVCKVCKDEAGNELPGMICTIKGVGLTSAGFLGYLTDIKYPDVIIETDRYISADLFKSLDHNIKKAKMVIHKFNIGDIVKISKAGSGCHSDTIGKDVTITEVGIYKHASGLEEPGYKIKETELMTNTKTGSHGGYNNEKSFVLVRSIIEDTDFSTKTPGKKMAPKAPVTPKRCTDIRTIDTSMINKEEVFKMLALAEATGLPCLLIGVPGVGKTKTILEYAKAWLNREGKMTAEDFINKIFILETDDGTKASEVKGIPDLGKLFTENKFHINAPIAEAEIVVINEVDKASAGIRNAMLGVMNEKFLFNGKHKIPCKWKLFVATCNEIPKEEKDSPFWDRFMLKSTVSRVASGDLVKYYKSGARSYKETFKLSVPTRDEMEDVMVPVNKLEKYLEVGYNSSSDRTLTFVPSLAKAVYYIWNVSIDKALVKTAEIMIGKTAGTDLSNKLTNNELRLVMAKVEMLHSHTSPDQLRTAVTEIENLITTYANRGNIDESQVQELESTMEYILSTHPVRVRERAAEVPLTEAEVVESN